MTYPFKTVVVPGGVVLTVPGETVEVIFVLSFGRRGWERRVDTNGNICLYSN